MSKNDTKIKEKLKAELLFLNNLIRNHEERKGIQSGNNKKNSIGCSSNISDHSNSSNNVINKKNTNCSRNTYKFVKNNQASFYKPSSSTCSLIVKNYNLQSRASNQKHNLPLSNKPCKIVPTKDNDSLIKDNSKRTVIAISESKQVNREKLSSSQTLCNEIICTTEKLKQRFDEINKVKNRRDVSMENKKNIKHVESSYSRVNNVGKPILNVEKVRDQSPKCLMHEINATYAKLQKTKVELKRTVLPIVNTSTKMECNKKNVANILNHNLRTRSFAVESMDVSALSSFELLSLNLDCDKKTEDNFESNDLPPSGNKNKQIPSKISGDNSASLKLSSALTPIKNIVKNKLNVTKSVKLSAALNYTTPISNRRKSLSINLSGNKCSVKKLSAKKNKIVSKYRVVNKASGSKKDTSGMFSHKKNSINFPPVKFQRREIQMKKDFTESQLDSKYKIVNKKTSDLSTYIKLHEKITNSEPKSLKKCRVVSSKYKVINRSNSVTNEKINKMLQLSSKKSEKSKYKLQNKKLSDSNIYKFCKPLSGRKILVKHKRLINSRFAIINRKLSPASKPWESPFKISPIVAKRLYKSPIKIINRNISPINQVARMIKTKYLIVNKNKNQHFKPCYSQLFYKKPLPINKRNSAHFMKHSSYPQHYAFPQKNRNMNYYSRTKRNYKRNPKRTKLLHIRGIPYNATSSKIVKKSRVSPKYIKNRLVQSPVLVIRGVRFAIDPSGKTLRRLPYGNINDSKSPRKIVIGGKTFVRVADDMLKEKNMFSKTLASRVLNKSIHTALAASTKKDMKKTNKYCIFYNRFGRCNDGIKCCYIHDPSKIAVCTRFLRGTCKIDGCLFSHEVSPGKMALCSFFLLGSCNKLKCPYRHEALAPGAKLCTDFVQGYCSKGKQCKKAHILVCPHYVQGNCENGSLCAYPHPPQKKRKTERDESENIETKSKDVAEVKEETDDNDLLEKVSRYFQCDNFTKNNAEIENCGSSEVNNIPNVVVSKRHKIPIQPSFIPLSMDDSAFS